jgi:PhnB protein
MFTSLTIGKTSVEFSDMPFGMEFNRGNCVSLIITYPNFDKAQKAFNNLSEEGQVFIPLTEIPNQGYNGMLIDKFGIGWMIRSN